MAHPCHAALAWGARWVAEGRLSCPSSQAPPESLVPKTACTQSLHVFVRVPASMSFGSGRKKNFPVPLVGGCKCTRSQDVSVHGDGAAKLRTLRCASAHTASYRRLLRLDRLRLLRRHRSAALRFATEASTQQNLLRVEARSKQRSVRQP
eukprot:362342-Chlamydomonas_euryale.AAC.13